VIKKSNMYNLMLKHLKGFYNYFLNINTKDNIALYGTFFVTFASIIGNFFAYLFQLIIAKVLSISEFGDLTALFSLMIFISAPLSIFSVSLVKWVSIIKNQNYPKKLTEFFYTILIFSFIYSFFVFILLFLLKNFIIGYLQLSTPKSYLFFNLYVFIANLTFIFLPILQSLQRFKAYSLLNLFNMFNRFLVALVSLIFSLKLINVLKLLFIQVIFSIFLAFLALKKNLVYSYFKFNMLHIKKVLKFAAFSSFSVLGLTLLLSTDILLVKHFFDSNIAGIYSSVTVLGKIVFWVNGPIILVAFPLFSEKYAKGIIPFKHLSYTFLAVLGVSFSIFLIMSLFPSFIISLLFGTKYSLASSFLPKYSLFMVLFSLNALFVQFFIAIERLYLSSLIFISLLIEYILIQLFFNKSIYIVLNVLVFNQFFMLTIFIIYLLYLKKYYLLKN